MRKKKHCEKIIQIKTDNISSEAKQTSSEA